MMTHRDALARVGELMTVFTDDATEIKEYLLDMLIESMMLMC